MVPNADSTAPMVAVPPARAEFIPGEGPQLTEQQFAEQQKLRRLCLRHWQCTYPDCCRADTDPDPRVHDGDAGHDRYWPRPELTANILRQPEPEREPLAVTVQATRLR
jgi:hypothetical protein